MSTIDTDVDAALGHHLAVGKHVAELRATLAEDLADEEPAMAVLGLPQLHSNPRR